MSGDGRARGTVISTSALASPGKEKRVGLTTCGTGPDDDDLVVLGGLFSGGASVDFDRGHGCRTDGGRGYYLSVMISS